MRMFKKVSDPRYYAWLLVVAALTLPGAPVHKSAAESATVLRFASLVPPGSPFMKVLKAWNRSVQEQTEGRVQLRFYSGGSQGDERDYVRKMRAGQLDAAAISSIGLGMLARPILVLSAPGVIHNYEELGRVQKSLSPRFEQMIDEAGFQLLAWGTSGEVRLFSKQRIEAPDDLKKVRPWAWKDDPIFTEFLRVIGANPVRLGIGEVYGGLQTGMIDVVPCSAVAVVALQWHTQLAYMTNDTGGIILGATIVKNDKFETLSPEDQETLRQTARRAGKFLDELARRDDVTAYRSLLKRGVVEVDISAHEQAWETAGAQTRENLVGRVYSRSLLEATQRAATGKSL